MVVRSCSSCPSCPVVLTPQSCPGNLVTVFLSRLSWANCLVLFANLPWFSCYGLSCCGFPTVVVLPWLSCHGCPARVVLPGLSFPRNPFPAVLSKLSCPCCHVLVSLSSLSCHGCPVSTVLPCCSIPTVLSQLFCSPCPVLPVILWSSVQSILPDRPVPAVHLAYPVLAVLGCLYIVGLSISYRTQLTFRPHKRFQNLTLSVHC